MAKRKTYADILRDALLELALIPVAGLHTASFWFKESLERTSRLAAEIVTTTALARSAIPANSAESRPIADDPTPDILAQDLVRAARTYVRSMVTLPGDSAIYFTGDLERNRAALLVQIQPDAETDLGTYVSGELERLGQEVDRLSLVARAAVQHPLPSSRATGRPEARRMKREREVKQALLKKIDGLRTSVKVSAKGVVKLIPPDQPAFISRGAAANRRLRALNTQRARTALEGALREMEALLPGHKESLARVRSVIKDLGELATGQLTPSTPPIVRRQRRSANGQKA